MKNADRGIPQSDSPNYERELASSFTTVVREAEALYAGSGRLQRTYERLAGRLKGAGISYSLLGGYALILHGVRRFTEDLDVLIRPESLAALKEELVGQGYTGVRGSARSIRDAETGVRIDFVVAGQFPGDGKPKPLAFPDPDSGITVTEHAVRVVTLKTLIELKLASGMTGSGRLQDLADVQRLIEVRRLTDGFARNLHPYVREKFLQLWRDLRGGSGSVGGDTS
jgi:hypothetical protein